MENLIKKYEYDMNRYEKKIAKMEKLDKQGIDYNADEISVTEDEGEKEFMNRMSFQRLNKG